MKASLVPKLPETQSTPVQTRIQARMQARIAATEAKIEAIYNYGIFKRAMRQQEGGRGPPSQQLGGKPQTPTEAAPDPGGHRDRATNDGRRQALEHLYEALDNFISMNDFGSARGVENLGGEIFGQEW